MRAAGSRYLCLWILIGKVLVRGGGIDGGVRGDGDGDGVLGETGGTSREREI